MRMILILIMVFSISFGNDFKTKYIGIVDYGTKWIQHLELTFRFKNKTDEENIFKYRGEAYYYTDDGRKMLINFSLLLNRDDNTFKMYEEVINGSVDKYDEYNGVYNGSVSDDFTIMEADFENQKITGTMKVTAVE